MAKHNAAVFIVHYKGKITREQGTEEVLAASGTHAKHIFQELFPNREVSSVRMAKDQPCH